MIFSLFRKFSRLLNADPLSQIPEEEFCNCYEAGVYLDDLPCGGCKYCTRMHTNWSRFERDVDDVVPLAIRTVCIEDDEDDLVDENSASQDGDSWLPQYPPEVLRRKQMEDPDLRTLIQWLEGDENPSTQELYLSSPVVKKFWLNRNLLVFQDKVLHYKWIDFPLTRKLVMVPKSLRGEVLQGCHNCLTEGHLGQKKTYDRVRRGFMWHETSLDVQLYIKTCATCSKSKKPRVKPRGELGSYHAGKRMERVHLDMMGPFPESDSGNKYILVMVDQLTKWVEVQPLPEISAETTARAAVDGFFSQFGYPEQIHTDQGKNFDGNLFRELCKMMRITKTRTMPYRPSSNGQVERYNRLLLQLSRCYINNRQGTWDEDLQLLAGAIRAMKNCLTGYSANMMMLLVEVTQPVDILMGTEGVEMRDENPSAYLKRLLKSLEEVHQLAHEHLRSHLCYQKRTYDLKLHQNHYDVGDLVYGINQVTKKGECRKLKAIWVGPLIITEVITPVLFRVRARKKEQVLHHDKLKLCEDRAIPMWMRRLRHQILDLDTTITYDEAEQEEITIQKTPKVDRNTDTLGLHCLFGTEEDGDAMAEQAVVSPATENAMAEQVVV